LPLGPEAEVRDPAQERAVRLVDETVVPSLLQAVSLEAWLQIVACRVEKEVLGNSQALIESLLDREILAACRTGSDLDHEIRRPSLLPELIERSVPFLDASNQDHVRGDRGAGVPLLVVEQEVAPCPSERIVQKVPLQGRDEVGHHLPMQGRFGHGTAVGGGVLDLLIAQRHRGHGQPPSPTVAGSEHETRRSASRG
jgi:hypothetical protein